MSDFTATYHPRDRTVTLTHALGLLLVTSTVPLAVYEARCRQWPGFYPDELRLPADWTGPRYFIPLGLGEA